MRHAHGGLWREHIGKPHMEAESRGQGGSHERDARDPLPWHPASRRSSGQHRVQCGPTGELCLVDFGSAAIDADKVRLSLQAELELRALEGVFDHR